MNVLSNCMEVSVSLSCISTTIPNCSSVLQSCFSLRFFAHEPPYQVPASVGLAQAFPNYKLMHDSISNLSKYLTYAKPMPNMNMSALPVRTHCSRYKRHLYRYDYISCPQIRLNSALSSFGLTSYEHLLILLNRSGHSTLELKILYGSKFS